MKTSQLLLHLVCVVRIILTVEQIREILNVELGGTYSNQRINNERHETKKCSQTGKSPNCSGNVGSIKKGYRQ
jgi:hypothetical protein